MEMNDNYWVEYYKNKERQKPSPFFEFCKDKIKKDDIVMDFGAGDFRDSYALHDIADALVCIEPNNKVKDLLHFETLEDFFKETKTGVDIIYGRWIIHAITKKEEKELLDYAVKVGATLMLEFRTDEDVPDDTHKRRLINPYEFQEKLKGKGFIIKDIKIGYGFSKIGNNDPHLCRIIAEKF